MQVYNWLFESLSRIAFIELMCFVWVDNAIYMKCYAKVLGIGSWKKTYPYT